MSSVTYTQTKRVHLLSTTSKKIMKYQNMCHTTTSSDTNVGEVSKTRKYMQRATGYSSETTTQSVLRRNARERNRVKQVNNSFARLRQHIPQTIITDLTKSGGRGPHKKISKVDTLRIAVEYIRHLQNLLGDLNDGGNSSSISSSSSHTNSNRVTLCTNIMTQNSFKDTDQTLKVLGTNKSNVENTSPENSLSPVADISRKMSPAIAAIHQLNFDQNVAPLSGISLSSYSPQYNAINQTDSGCNSSASSINSSMFSHSQQKHQKREQFMERDGSDLVDHLQLKFEPHDNIHLNDDNCPPDDDEILDYISLWQDQ